MANELAEKAKGLYTMNQSAAAQLKELESAESCPTCGGPMKAAPMPEDEMSPEQGGKHTLMGALTGTNYPGFKTRKLKAGEKISGH